LRFLLLGLVFAGQISLADELAIGPAADFVWQYSEKLNLGAFSQNGFAGDTAVSQMQLAPH